MRKGVGEESENGWRLTDCVVVEAKVRGWNRHSSSDGCVVVLVLQLAPGLGPFVPQNMQGSIINKPHLLALASISTRFR
jgi:hypothetical protein